jgi:hypothetical protein
MIYEPVIEHMIIYNMHKAAMVADNLQILEGYLLNVNDAILVLSDRFSLPEASISVIFNTEYIKGYAKECSSN